MRLNRLDLVRYGKFTERSLDFGAPRPGKPDFHLVHGPNEAGKSTLFSAYLDLLFGIEKTSAYGFLHPYALMRVGGRLSIGADAVEAYRLKRNQGTLVAADDRPLPDTLFASVLGGMDRSAYRTMFSLDDESIEKGGEDILKSEGELGAMLFSASSGLSDMASGLAALKAEADDFYRPAGRKHGLSTLKTEIEALAAERKALDVAARDYGLLVRERDEAARRHAEASAERAEARAALGQAERSLEALPALRRLRALRAELGAFDLGDSPPPGWRTLLGELAREEAEITARTEGVAAERDRSAEERAGLSEDAAVLEAEADIAALAGSALEARFRTAAMDLAAREGERDRLAATLRAEIAALGLPPEADPTEILLPPGLGEKLTAQLSRRAALAERAEAALRERAEAEKALEAARAAQDCGAEGDEAQQVALGAALRAARSGDLPGRLREARRLLALGRREAEAAMAGLAPWSGTTAALAALPVPSSSELESLRKRREAAEDALRRQQEQVAVLTLESAGAKARLDALQAITGAAGEEQAGRLRAGREEAWQAHLARLDRQTAAAFEAAMRDDDRATDARLRSADRLSEIRLLERSVADGSARLAALAGETERLEAARTETDAEIAAAARRCGLPAETPLPETAGWIERRSAALAMAADLARRGTEADVVEEEARVTLLRLAGLLGADFPAGTTFEEAVFLAEDRLEALKTAEARRLAAAERHTRATAEAEARGRAAGEAADTLSAWQAAWQRDIAGTWLTTDRAPGDPERLAALLPALQALARTVERHRELEHRIAAMRRDQEDYTGHAQRLAGRLGEAFDAADPLAAVAGLARRLAAAKAVHDRRAALDKALARLGEEARTLEERRAALAARLSEIFAFLGCTGLAEAEILLESYRRRDDLLDRIGEAARDLARQMRLETAEEAEAVLSTVDEDQLAGERADLAARLDDLDRAVEEQHLAKARADEALSKIAGSDAAAALEERRRTALVDLAERSRRYLATRAGILAAEQALRLYRERHRSRMMERASHTFRAITGGEYAGLSTVLEKDGEFLVANAASGASKLAKDLSKGTRFQLYLALRVAGYHEIAETRETVPFIADDIMETFDDGRALNALRVMGEMARGGQVIYLTHHRHLRDLAREACPDVAIHEL